MDSSLIEDSAGRSADEIWNCHESDIRLLYQTEELKEVKKIMETKHGFPRLAIKTWHEKLGNHRIRKTAPNQVWRKIYQHCAYYRLEDPSRKQGDKRLKRTKKPTEVIYGGRKYSWDRAWKNMKRAGAIVEARPNPPSPLPAGMTVRTPPTMPSSPSPRMSSNTLQRRDKNTTAIQAQSPFTSFGSDLIRKDETDSAGRGKFIQQSRLLESCPDDLLPPEHCSLDDCLRAQMLVRLPGLPIWKTSNTLAEMAGLDLSSQKSPWVPWAPTAASLPLTISGIELPDESVFHIADMFSCLTITQPSSTIATFSARHSAYLIISTAIYLLSNNLVNPSAMSDLSDHKRFFDVLDSIFKEVPVGHLRVLIQRCLASVRGAFEALLITSGRLEQRVAFKALVNIGAENGWLATSAKGHEYLCYAIRMDLDDVVQILLDNRCRPHKYAWLPWGDTTAIVEALRRRQIGRAEKLLSYCDVNSQFEMGGIIFTSFTLSIRKMNDLDGILFNQGIKLFLRARADINSIIGSRQDYTPVWTVKDYLFCFHTRLFHEVMPDWSPSDASQPSRAGILMSLQDGPTTLIEYCHSLAQHVGSECLYDYLERLVAEHLTGFGPWYDVPRRAVDLQTVYTLVGPQIGVSMDNVLRRAPRLLADCLQGNEAESDTEVIRYLLQNGAAVSEESLQKAFRLENADLIALLIQKMNIPQQGPQAIVAAARANNFEAVNTLIDAGVDVNTELETDHGPFSVFYEIVHTWESSFQDLEHMINFLLQRGGRFRLSAMKTNLSDLMESVIKYGISLFKYGAIEGLVRWFIEQGGLSGPEVASSARLLEACGHTSFCSDARLEIFELLFENGALLRPGAPLAACIRIGGGMELVEKMLDTGVDINAYLHGGLRTRTALQEAAERCSEELVGQLLRKDASVNGPARGLSGGTALQAICKYQPRSPAEKTRQLRIIQLLLNCGADVNAAPARRYGLTALQAAAFAGNLEVAVLLLSCDPPADVNMPSCQNPTFHYSIYPNALDLAAHFGRLDMVKLLLNNNALSSDPGITGYDVAIQTAERQGHLAVADLVREHAATISRSDAWRTNLSQPQRDWREYVYDDSSDGYKTHSDDDDEDGPSLEPEDEQVPVVQMQVQYEAVEQPGFEHTAPGPGFVWDLEVDEPRDFNIGFGNLVDDMRSL